MIRALILMLACVSATAAQSPSPRPTDAPVMLQYINARLEDVFRFYKYLSKKTISVESHVDPAQIVSVYSRNMKSSAEALSFIRETLRSDGIEIREVGDSEAYVSCVAQ
jgi:hypothetical protein